MIAEQTSTRTTRRRAVRLTQRGLPVLEEALLAAWATRGIERKPTWEDRAELLEVSVVTARKILGCEGVDRSTLTHAFKKLGVTWKESYCEFVVQIAPSACVAIEKTPPNTRPPFFQTYLFDAILIFIFVLPWLLIRVFTISDLQYGEIMVKAGFDLYMKGDYKAARNHQEVAKRIGVDWANFYLMRATCTLEAHLDVVNGNYASANELYLRVIHYNGDLHDPQNLPAGYMDLAEVETLQGHLDQARSHLDQSIVGFMKLGDKTGVALVERDIGTVLTQQHKLDEADEWLGLALHDASALGKPDIVEDVRGRQAIVLREQKHFDAARTILGQTLAYWDNQNHRRWTARSLLDLGTVEVAAGNDVIAKRLLTKAKSIYSDVGGYPGIQECEQWLSKCEQPSR